MSSVGTAQAQEKAVGSAAEPFGYCLNTSTISGQKLALPKVAEIAAKAGYGAIEPWIREIDAYVKAGGSLDDLRKRIADLGLTVESAIGFFDWAVDDEKRRAGALESAKRDMELVRKIGGKRIAAPPAGATDVASISLMHLAERYRELLKVGDEAGVVPQVEVWGFSKCLGRLSEAIYVAAEANHPKACILADIYHLHRGGSGYAGLSLLGPKSMHVLHVNDFPAGPAAQLNDSQRVYPGDGVAPLGSIFRTLRDIGWRGFLSLELFQRDYWKLDAAEVAKTGLEKTRKSVREALA